MKADHLEAARDRLIVALDLADLKDMIPLIAKLQPEVRWFKVGHQLCKSFGTREVVATAYRAGATHVMLDEKLADIGNTVAEAIRTIGKWANHLPTTMTIYGMISDEALKMAVAAARNAGITPIGITVPTDWGTNDVWNVFGCNLDEAILRVAHRLVRAGFTHAVCSPKELRRLRNDQMAPALTCITPGIRPAGTVANDQVRIGTPAKAIQEGAHQLVVGRPITNADDPKAAAIAILEEIAAALPMQPASAAS